jgi:hypothetical protein
VAGSARVKPIERTRAFTSGARYLRPRYSCAALLPRRIGRMDTMSDLEAVLAEQARYYRARAG